MPSRTPSFCTRYYAIRCDPPSTTTTTTAPPKTAPLPQVRKWVSGSLRRNPPVLRVGTSAVRTRVFCLRRARLIASDHVLRVCTSTRCPTKATASLASQHSSRHRATRLVNDSNANSGCTKRATALPLGRMDGWIVCHNLSEPTTSREREREKGGEAGLRRVLCLARPLCRMAVCLAPSRR